MGAAVAIKAVETRQYVRTFEELNAAPLTAEFNYKEAALFLKTSLRTLYNLVSDQQGPQKFSRVGRGVYFIKADLIAWDKSGRKVVKAFN